MKIIAVCIAVVFACLPLVAEEAKKPEKVAIPEDLGKRIDEAIGLLDKKDYENFVEKFVPPDQLKQMKAAGVNPKDMGKKMEEHAPALLQVLKKVKSDKVLLSDEGKVATFNLDAADLKDLPKDLPKEVEFVKIDGSWYLK